MIWTGAEMLAEGATGLAIDYGISESVISLPVVALGTSLPELAVTLVAGLRGQGGVAIGNILGSKVINILGILGLPSVYAGGIIIAPQLAGRDIWVVVLTSGFDDRMWSGSTGGIAVQNADVSQMPIATGLDNGVEVTFVWQVSDTSEGGNVRVDFHLIPQGGLRVDTSLTH